MAATTPSDPASRSRSLYLDLLEKVLLNTIYEDEALNRDARGQSFEARRTEGRDWPSTAHTMVGRIRLHSLREMTETVVQSGIEGHLIETGVWRGGASILMRGVLAAYGDTTREVICADSFEGLPRPNPQAYPADRSDTLYRHAELAIPLETVQENFRRYRLLDDQVRFVKGWFKDTLPALSSEKFALIRLDGDMYESTMDALNALYDGVSPGGFIIIDDYGAVGGCRKAVEDFRNARGITDPIKEIDWTGVFWRKSAI